MLTIQTTTGHYLQHETVVCSLCGTNIGFHLDLDHFIYFTDRNSFCVLIARIYPVN